MSGCRRYELIEDGRDMVSLECDREEHPDGEMHRTDDDNGNSLWWFTAPDDVGPYRIPASADNNYSVNLDSDPN